MLYINFKKNKKISHFDRYCDYFLALCHTSNTFCYQIKKTTFIAFITKTTIKQPYFRGDLLNYIY